MAETVPARPPFAPQSIVWQKRAGLPVWAWLVMGLALAFVAMWWRRNKASAAEMNTGYTGSAAINQQQNPVYIIPQQTIPPIINTWPGVPPGSGRHHPPTTNPGSAYPPPPNDITVQQGGDLVAWANPFFVQYGVDFGRLEGMYPGFNANLGGGGNGKPAYFKSTKTFHRVS